MKSIDVLQVQRTQESTRSAGPWAALPCRDRPVDRGRVAQPPADDVFPSTVTTRRLPISLSDKSARDVVAIATQLELTIPAGKVTVVNRICCENDPTDALESKERVSKFVLDHRSDSYEIFSPALGKRIAALSMVIAAGYAFLVARSQFLTGDPTFYVGLAESLVEGRGYTFMGVPHAMYPPGLPLVLAPFVAIGGPDLILLQAVVAVFALLSVAAVLFMFREWDPRLAVAVGLLVLFNHQTFAVTTIGIHAELPFLAVSVAALGCVHATWRGSLSHTLGLVLTPVLVVSAVGLRTIGVALPLALLAAWFHRRVRMGFRHEPVDRVLLAGAVAGMASAGSWFLWGAMNDSDSYFDLLLLVNPHQPDLGVATPLAIVGRIPGALRVQLTHFGELAGNIPWLKPLWASPLAVLLGVGLTTGTLRELRQPNPTLGWYVMGYGAILLMWPFDEGARFMLPVFPLLIALTWRGVGSIVATLRQHFDKRTVVIGFALGSLLLVFALVEANGAGGFSRQNWAVLAAWAGVLFAWGLLSLRPSFALAAMKFRGGALCSFLLAYSVVGLWHITETALGNVGGQVRSPNPGMQAGVEWLLENADRQDVVMGEFASSIHFYTDLTAVTLPRTADRDALLTSLAETGATYVLVNYPPEFPYYRPTEMERLRILLGEKRIELSLVHRFGSGEIYRVK